MTARLLPYGRHAVLVELDDPAPVPTLTALLRDDPRFEEVVPGARTVLVRTRDVASARSVLPELAERAVASGDSPAGPEVVLDVVYDGPDLDSVAAATGLDVAGVIAAHTGADYVVAFCGFAPGFAYLTGLPPVLQLPRLSEPRPTVPAGSVAVAGEFTGVYPRASPGGWRLLGRTTAPLWDVRREPPALLAPGTRVRFRELR